MCLAIPVKVVKVDREKETAEVVHRGETAQASSQLVKPEVGDYVIVQFGFITEILDKEEAESKIETWRGLDARIGKDL